MSALLTASREADWLETPVSVRALINAQRQEIGLLHGQLTVLATELANLQERIGRTTRNSPKPRSSDRHGLTPSKCRRGNGRKRGGQQSLPGSGPEQLPIERVDEVVGHYPVLQQILGFEMGCGAIAGVHQRLSAAWRNRLTRRWRRRECS